MTETVNLEIERKFLVEFPDIDTLDVKRCISITQTYLKDGKDGSQRRVRKISDNGILSYTYTEKIFESPVVRHEKEKEISESEYNELLFQAKKEFTPVIKTRYCFDYKCQLFELDTYPFSDKLAVMELELSDPEQVICLPDSVKVIREVTGEKLYSNSALANAGRFPKGVSDEYAGAKGDING